MRRRLEAIIPRIYGLLLGLSMLFFTVFYLDVLPKKPLFRFKDNAMNGVIYR